MRVLISTCPTCDSLFSTPVNADGTPHKLCCSVKCSYIARGLKRRKPKVEHVCPVCEKVFLTNLARKSVYCSQQCAGFGTSKPARTIMSICDYCGQQFAQRDPSNWNTCKPQRFCSQVCKGKGIAKERGLYVRVKATFICEHCSQPFTRLARAGRKYHFCCQKCYYAERRGEKHHCWQGGTDRYYGPNWDEQRIKALERDIYICQQCGISEKGMHVHHKILRSKFGHDWETMNNLSNLITLCSACHARKHIRNLNSAPVSI